MASTLLAMLCFSIISSSSSGNAARDVYKSGYKHGCDDAGISNPADRYVNQPEAGPSLNSDEFMHGYNDGFGACSGSNDGDAEYENLAKELCEEFGYLCQQNATTRPECQNTYDLKVI
jgi:hypothetical protein